jgi:methylenetetrahydrofolate reductase (NADPH)
MLPRHLSARFDGVADSPTGGGPKQHHAARALLSAIYYEIVPTGDVERAMADLPEGASVSVTCLASRGLGPTLQLTEHLLSVGHHPVPHIAARLVGSAQEASELADHLRQIGLKEVFVVAGDMNKPAGPFGSSLEFLEVFLAAGPGVDRVGIAGYPEAHPSIASDVLWESISDKQSLLDDLELEGWISTQICFDALRLREWMTSARSRGIHLPIRLGVPGAIDRGKLLRIGPRIGIGPSLRFMAKNRTVFPRLISRESFDPTNIVLQLSDHAEELDIRALHCFTFNEVAATRTWRDALMAATS